MFKFKHFLANLALAAATIAACGQAAATPLYYHVDINTASLGTGPAWLDLYFLGLAGAADATATVSHLTGALDGTADLLGSVTGSAPGPFVFSNAGGAGGGELIQAIQLGGQFSFEVSFALAAGDTGTTFGWALFDTTHYLGVDGDLGNFLLQPDAPLGQQIFVAAPPASLGGVTGIAEPSTAALMAVAVLAMLARHGRSARRD
jgi:hypothetical protein